MSVRRKPTPGYIALQQKLRENALLEEAEQVDKALAKEMEKDAQKAYNDAVAASEDKKKQKEKVQKEYGQFKLQVKSDILESVLSTIVQNSLPSVINETNFVNSIVREFVENEGVLDILDHMSTKTQLLSELSLAINEAYDEEIENVDPEDPDSYLANTKPSTELIDNIKGDEEISDVTDIIKNKVSRATEEFIEKNIIDQADIKDTLADTKARMDQVKTGDNALDEEIRKEQTIAAKRKIKAIGNRPHTVFEQLVINMTEAVLKNEALKESYVYEDGKLNMNSIVERATCIYTLMETVNTLKIKPLDEESIQSFITFE